MEVPSVSIRTNNLMDNQINRFSCFFDDFFGLVDTFILILSDNFKCKTGRSYIDRGTFLTRKSVYKNKKNFIILASLGT